MNYDYVVESLRAVLNWHERIGKIVTARDAVELGGEDVATLHGGTKGDFGRITMYDAVTVLSPKDCVLEGYANQLLTMRKEAHREFSHFMELLEKVDDELFFQKAVAA